MANMYICILTHTSSKGKYLKSMATNSYPNYPLGRVQRYKLLNILNSCSHVW